LKNAPHGVSWLLSLSVAGKISAKFASWNLALPFYASTKGFFDNRGQTLPSPSYQGLKSYFQAVL
jgi:hypothetical protein